MAVPAPVALLRGLRSAHALSLVLRLGTGGPELGRERVTRRDLANPFAESWSEGHLRRGRPDVELEQTRACLHPVWEEAGPPACRAFLLVVEHEQDEPVACRFPPEALSAVAARASRRLQERGVLTAGDRPVYELLAEDSPESPWGEEPGAAAGVRLLGAPSPTRISYRRLCLPPLLRQARGLGTDADGGRLPLLFTASALEKAERVARRGASADPPVETGGVLVGSLLSCPETGELATAVSDVLEATDADETRFSLTFSSRTWMRIQAVLAAKGRHPATASERIVGSTHGHPFRIGGDEPPCEDCARRAECSRSSAFLSSDDLVWSHAVFAATPWQVAAVFGIDALDRTTEAVYGQRGGRLLRRGYHVLPDEVWASAIASEC